MSKINRAIREVRRMTALAEADGWPNRLHPLAKLLVTFLYIAVVVSFTPYNLTGLLGMSVYPVVLFTAGEISFKESLYRMRIVLPLVCCVGLFNPFFDTQVLFLIGQFKVTSGMVSMVTLMIKGILTVLAAYLLIVTATIEELCYALRRLHVPRVLVTVVLLIYRYLSVLMEEVRRMSQAYSLRAPAQKGLHIKTWGSFVGMLLLRSVDRAQRVYESMCIRGFRGEFYLDGRKSFGWTDGIYLAVWTVVLLLFRKLPVFSLIGGLFI